MSRHAKNFFLAEQHLHVGLEFECQCNKYSFKAGLKNPWGRWPQFKDNSDTHMAMLNWPDGVETLPVQSNQVWEVLFTVYCEYCGHWQSICAGLSLWIKNPQQAILPLLSASVFVSVLRSGHTGGPSDHMLCNPTQSSLAVWQHPAQSRSDYVAVRITGCFGYDNLTKHIWYG